MDAEILGDRLAAVEAAVLDLDGLVDEVIEEDETPAEVSDVTQVRLAACETGIAVLGERLNGIEEKLDGCLQKLETTETKAEAAESLAIAALETEQEPMEPEVEMEVEEVEPEGEEDQKVPETRPNFWESFLTLR